MKPWTEQIHKRGKSSEKAEERGGEKL